MSTKPRIMTISLDFGPSIDRMHGNLINRLEEKADLERPEEVEEIISALRKSPAPSAVLIMDQAVANDFPEVWDAVLAYVRAGGTAIALSMFASLVVPANIEPFFAKAGLAWKSGDYFRTEMKLRPDVVGNAAVAAKLPDRVSVKALQLRGVRPEDLLYGPDERSYTQSHVFASEKVQDTTQAAVAFAKVGAGRVGYVGDVNFEEDLDDVIMAMCGLLA